MLNRHSGVSSPAVGPNHTATPGPHQAPIPSRISEPVQSTLVALIGQGSQGVSVSYRRSHDTMLQRCPRGKVNRRPCAE